MIQRRFQIKNTEMKMVKVNKAQFSGLNDKKHYFSDGIVYFPYVNPLLHSLCQKQKEYKEKVHKIVKETKLEMLK